jgi:MFS transporter, Spinster family, sphingosine-1-phosphate transporter
MGGTQEALDNRASGKDAGGKKTGSGAYSSWVLFMLFVVYAFNFLDRQIISILAIPIKEELGLDDRELGLLGGIAFALLYSVLGVPIAWLADRLSRTWIITISLTVWSGFTALCGLAQNFGQLFAARVGVGVGEAGGVAPSYALIADYFPPSQRARALAIYSLGIPIGSAFGVVAGSQIAGGAIGENLDWRAAFIIVGVAGLLVAPLFKLTVREPVRGAMDGAAAKPVAEAGSIEPEAPSTPLWSFLPSVSLLARPSIYLFLAGLGAVLWTYLQAPSSIPEWLFHGLLVAVPFLLIVLNIVRRGAMKRHGGTSAAGIHYVLSKRSFWLMTAGATFSSMMGYGVFFWIPSFFARSYGLNIIDTGLIFGAVLLFGGTLGILLGGFMGDLMGKGRKRAYALVPAIAFLITAPLYVLGTLSPTATIAMFVFMLPTAMGLAWLGPVLSAFQHLATPGLRALTSASFLLFNNLFGIGVGIYVLGDISTRLTPVFGDEALRYSIMIGASLYVVAAILFLFAARTLEKDWEH